jgi:diguanylate cyclase (GGDEF)-like protein
MAPVSRRALTLLALASYAAVFVAFLVLETPGLGIGHFYYISIALLALASGPTIGAAGGLGATALYVVGVLVNPHVPPASLLTESTLIRLVTFTGVGLLLGWFASEHRALVARLEVLAGRDQLTGLPNTRSFEAAITRRLDAGEPFGLLIGDMDRLGMLNDVLGRAEGDDALRRVADSLTTVVGPDGELARVGGDEFAVLVSARSTDELARIAGRLETALGDRWSSVTFGWSAFPREGVNALSLYRAADERLYARKLVRKKRQEDVLAAEAGPSPA